MQIHSIDRSPEAPAVARPAERREATVGISTIVGLRRHLQWAVELEHSTLPSYLYALYSLDRRTNPETVELLTSVVLEEMLHLGLIANLLTAVGGRPELDRPRMLPSYPRRLPHSSPAIELSLLPFGREALEMLLRVERPCGPDAPAEADDYETIAQFYAALEVGLVALCRESGESAAFSGDRRRQVAAAFHDGMDDLFEITGLDDALRALDLVVAQGEGTQHTQVWDGDRDMFRPDRPAVGHFYRLRQLEIGRRYQQGDTPSSDPSGDAIRVDWDEVRPLRRNPRRTDLGPGTLVRQALDRANSSYCTLLNRLEQTFDGAPAMLDQAIATMFELKARSHDLSELSEQNELGGLGPSFEFVPPEDRI